MEQLALIDTAPTSESPAPPTAARPRKRCPACGGKLRPERDLAAAWKKEIEAHPVDEEKLERHALLLASQTTKRIRIAKVWEDMRAEVGCDMDNSYRAAAARRMMERHPALRGRFTTRSTAAAARRRRRR